MKTTVKFPVFAFALLVVLSCAHDKCTDVTSVTPVFIEAMNNPETFDDYVNGHRDSFDNNFFTCMDQKLAELDKTIADKINYCQEIFDDPDLLNGCYNDYVVGPENLRTILFAIEATANGTTRWDNTGAGAQLIDMKLSDPEFWDELMELFYDSGLQINCRLCEEERCFLGICG